MINETSNECATNETGCHVVGTDLTVLKFEMCFPMECIQANKKIKTSCQTYFNNSLHSSEYLTLFIW